MLDVQFGRFGSFGSFGCAYLTKMQDFGKLLDDSFPGLADMLDQETVVSGSFLMHFIKSNHYLAYLVDKSKPLALTWQPANIDVFGNQNGLDRLVGWLGKPCNLPGKPSIIVKFENPNHPGKLDVVFHLVDQSRSSLALINSFWLTAMRCWYDGMAVSKGLHNAWPEFKSSVEPGVVLDKFMLVDLADMIDKCEDRLIQVELCRYLDLDVSLDNKWRDISLLDTTFGDYYQLAPNCNYGDQPANSFRVFLRPEQLCEVVRPNSQPYVWPTDQHDIDDYRKFCTRYVGKFMQNLDKTDACSFACSDGWQVMLHFYRNYTSQQDDAMMDAVFFPACAPQFDKLNELVDYSLMDLFGGAAEHTHWETPDYALFVLIKRVSQDFKECKLVQLDNCCLVCVK